MAGRSTCRPRCSLRVGLTDGRVLPLTTWGLATRRNPQPIRCRLTLATGLYAECFIYFISTFLRSIFIAAWRLIVSWHIRSSDRLSRSGAGVLEDRAVFGVMARLARTAERHRLRRQRCSFRLIFQVTPSTLSHRI